jgi:hypothetical protein
MREFILPGSGLKCGECNSILPIVNRTIKTPGFVTRERRCPNCGKINTTSERVINTRNKKRKFSDPCD